MHRAAWKGQAEKRPFPFLLWLPFYPERLPVSVGRRAARLVQVRILSGMWKWSAFRTVASGGSSGVPIPFIDFPSALLLYP